MRHILLFFVFFQIAGLIASEIDMQNKMQALMNRFKSELYHKTSSGRLTAYKDSACSIKLSVKDVLSLQAEIIGSATNKQADFYANWQNPQYILMINTWVYETNAGKTINTDFRSIGIAYHYDIEYPRTINSLLFFKKEEALLYLNSKELGLMLAYFKFLATSDSPIALSKSKADFFDYASLYSDEMLKSSRLIYGAMGSIQNFSSISERSLIQFSAERIHQAILSGVYNDSNRSVEIGPEVQKSFFQKEVISAWPCDPNEGCAFFDSVYVIEFTPKNFRVEYLKTKGLFWFYNERGEVELTYFVEEHELLAQVGPNLKPILTWLIE